MHLLTAPPETGSMSGAERRWLTDVENAVNALITHVGLSDEDYAKLTHEASDKRTERLTAPGVVLPDAPKTLDDLVKESLEKALRELGVGTSSTKPASDPLSKPTPVGGKPS